MELKAFIATRRYCEDLRQIADSPYGSNNSEPDTYPDPISGYLYGDSFAIQQHAADNGFTCFIQFEESSPDLRSLELELWYWHGRDFGAEVDLTLFDRVELACLQSDIDRALRYVQDGIGVRSGDFAALHFSDLADNAWGEMSRVQRLRRLSTYIAAEVASETEWRQAADSNSATAALESM
jgi:hypothetical protein